MVHIYRKNDGNDRKIGVTSDDHVLIVLLISFHKFYSN